MSRKKVCKHCKIIVEKEECPLCKGTQFSTNWKGRVYILSAKSDIGKKTGMTAVGEYAIKVS